MASFIEEFKAFAIKGNIMDLAIAVIIGTAFNKIVSSLVDAIIMPIIGIFIGGIDFSNLTFTFGKVSLKYGQFIQNVVDFFIIAFVVFMVVKGMNRFRRPQTAVVKDEPKEPSEEVKLLTEIRDVLRQR